MARLFRDANHILAILFGSGINVQVSKIVLSMNLKTSVCCRDSGFAEGALTVGIALIKLSIASSSSSRSGRYPGWWCRLTGATCSVCCLTRRPGRRASCAAWPDDLGKTTALAALFSAPQI